MIVHSGALDCAYSEKEGRIVDLTFNGKPVSDDTRITLGLVDYLVKNAKGNFGDDFETLIGCKPVPVSEDAMMEVENALRGRNDLKLNSAHRFRRIFADGSVLSPDEDNAGENGKQ